MELILIWILASTLLVSLLSLLGIFTFSLKEKFLKKILLILVGFSAGALMGGAFLHLIPESLESSPYSTVFLFVLLGFAIFFLIERYLHWHHCHEGKCDVHTFTYMNLIGDGIHNFIDGAIIAISFLVNIPFGIITTVAIMAHELPQELSDFAVLVHGGFSKQKALLFNFLSGVVGILGALTGYFLSTSVKSIIPFIIPFAAGGFIYIAASDLVPELHKELDLKKSILSFLFFVLGIVFMYLTKSLLH